MDAIAPAPDDVFLEIGPGPGVLTLRLAPKVARLVAIEIDRDLVAQPRAEAAGECVDSFHGDVLELDLDAALATADVSDPVRVAGNLPYNISSPILFRLLRSPSASARSGMPR